MQGNVDSRRWKVAREEWKWKGCVKLVNSDINKRCLLIYILFALFYGEALMKETLLRKRVRIDPYIKASKTSYSVKNVDVWSKDRIMDQAFCLYECQRQATDLLFQAASCRILSSVLQTISVCPAEPCSFLTWHWGGHEGFLAQSYTWLGMKNKQT